MWFWVEATTSEHVDRSTPAHSHPTENRQEAHITTTSTHTLNMADAQAIADQNVHMFKIKRLIKGLSAARGNGTSMISLIVPVSTLHTR